MTAKVSDAIVAPNLKLPMNVSEMRGFMSGSAEEKFRILNSIQMYNLIAWSSTSIFLLLIPPFQTLSLIIHKRQLLTSVLNLKKKLHFENNLLEV